LVDNTDDNILPDVSEPALNLEVLGFVNESPPTVESNTEECLVEHLAAVDIPSEDHHMLQDMLSELVSTKSDIASSSASAAVTTVPRARGRPRRVATPSVDNQVRHSTRQFNDGILYELPNATRRRSSSVTRATPPAMLQIAEMQRIGVEDCLVDASELSEERLMQSRFFR
jgi:hypothetical protein